jgi:hypothetical protein
VVSDGEMSKPSYTTYIRHRVDGIALDARAAEKGRDIMIGRDLLAHPDFARSGNFVATAFPGCVDELRYKDRSALDRDIAHLKAAAAKSHPTEVFMTAPSPGILTRFIINLHYPSEDAYVAALADVLKVKHRAIVEAGFIARFNGEWQRCRDLEIVEADAAEFVVPDKPLVIFFYNPFAREVFDTVLQNIVASLTTKKRTCYVIYGRAALAILASGHFETMAAEPMPMFFDSIRTIRFAAFRSL